MLVGGTAEALIEGNLGFEELVRGQVVGVGELPHGIVLGLRCGNRLCCLARLSLCRRGRSGVIRFPEVSEAMATLFCRLAHGGQVGCAERLQAVAGWRRAFEDGGQPRRAVIAGALTPGVSGAGPARSGVAFVVEGMRLSVMGSKSFLVRSQC